jgi:hypothetical protein
MYILYTTTHKKDLDLHDLNMLSSNMKADHLRHFNSLSLPKFGKYKTNNKTHLSDFL